MASLTRKLTTRFNVHHLPRFHRAFTQTKIDKSSEGLHIDMDTAPETAITAFKTLYMRYADTLQDNSVLNDNFSLKYIESFSYSPNHLPPNRPKISSILEPYRAKLIDLHLIQWIESRYAEHIIAIEDATTDTPQIINPHCSDLNRSVLHIIELGIGFDTRFERIFLHNFDNKNVKDVDYFEDELSKIKEDDDDTFNSKFQIPLICDTSNTIQYNDYDIVYYYEIDLTEIIEIRKELINYNKIDQIIYKHNNKHLLDNNNSTKPSLIHNTTHKLYRKMYSYSVNDLNWFKEIKKDIYENHLKHTGIALNKDMSNVCIVCESLFLFISQNEMIRLIENCCNEFIGGYIICDESFTNEGIMDIENNIIKKNWKHYEIKSKIYMLKIDEIKNKLSFFIKWTIAKAAQNHYKILSIRFLKRIIKKH